MAVWGDNGGLLMVRVDGDGDGDGDGLKVAHMSVLTCRWEMVISYKYY